MKKPSRSHLDNPRTWEPALSQLLRLEPDQLDLLVRRWLAAAGAAPILRWPKPAEPSTYSAVAGSPTLPVPAQVRVYRRQRRLQAHHIEAFLGHLALTGNASGILIGTAGYTAAASRTASASKLPHVRLLSGTDWLEELAGCGAGVRPCASDGWEIDLSPPAGARSVARDRW